MILRAASRIFRRFVPERQQVWFRTAVWWPFRAWLRPRLAFVLNKSFFLAFRIVRPLFSPFVLRTWLRLFFHSQRRSLAMRRGDPVDFLYVGCSFPPVVDGQGVVIGRLLRALPAGTYAIATTADHNVIEHDAAHKLPAPYYYLPRADVGGRLKRALGLPFLLYRSYRTLSDAISIHQPRAVVACSGNVLSVLAAYMAAVTHWRTFYFHQFDSFVHQWWRQAIVMRFAQLVENVVGSTTKNFIVPCEELAAHVRERRPHSRISIVRNPGPVAAADRPPLVTNENRTGPKVLLFTGSVYYINHQMLLTVQEAIAAMPEGTAELHIYGGQDHDAIRAMGLDKPFVKLFGALQPHEIVQVQSAADVLLLGFSDIPAGHALISTSATAKLADLLLSAQPILCMAPEDSYVARYVRDNACGLLVSDQTAANVRVALESLFQPQPAIRQAAYDCYARDFDPADAQQQFLLAIDFNPFKTPHQNLNTQKVRPALRIMQVSGCDAPGVQANGYLLHKYYQARGLQSDLVVSIRQMNDHNVHELSYGWREPVNMAAAYVERKMSRWHHLPVLGQNLLKIPEYRDADILHFQLIHVRPFTNWDVIPRLVGGKKIVWTLHEMHMMTGHCNYSLDCDRWLQGCGSCPHLDTPFPITRDTSAAMFQQKKRMFERLRQVHLVVGSPWMRDRASRSPILAGLPLHYIPFGINLDIYSPRQRDEVRRQLDIPLDAHVICFRSVNGFQNFKGMQHIFHALRTYQPTRPTYLITFEHVGGLKEFEGKYGLREYGWTENQDLLARGLSASDAFLMPSNAEAFGLMAIEAQACGAVPLVMDGTALPDTIGGAECGMIVPQGDSAAYAAALDKVLNDESMRRTMQQNGMRHVRENHDFVVHAERHLDLYEAVVKGAA